MEPRYAVSADVRQNHGVALASFSNTKITKEFRRKMHYLEDYLELIEQLPVDLRERFTEMREMDLQVQNAIDTLEQKVKEFLSNGVNATEEWREESYKNLKNEYSKAMEDAEEKVNIASQIYDLVDRHLRKLDQELAKFKMELEADNAGITEILEKRSLLLDEPTQAVISPMNNPQPLQPLARNILPPTAQSQKRKASAIDIFTEDLPNGDISVPVSTVSLPDYNSYHNSLNPYEFTPKMGMTSSQPQSIQYTLGSVGASSAAAVSVAHSPSSSYQMQGRKRSSNMKGYPPTPTTPEYPGLPNNSVAAAAAGSQFNSFASYNNAGNGLPVNYTPTSSSLTSLSHVDISQSLSNSQGSSKQYSRKKQKTTDTALATTPLATTAATSTALQQVTPEQEVLPAGVDWTYDPNEPRYCLCNQVSYGEMVGCDNPACPIEWFHYGCVGIVDSPKGKWYCPKCTVIMNKRKRR